METTEILSKLKVTIINGRLYGLTKNISIESILKIDYVICANERKYMYSYLNLSFLIDF